ncbi:BnaC04g18640D [Brassica napus]|uniref:BnaC04g18640D protein n=1 Tax=Brassica napus TaxID=3708 RepID=A0A078GPZ7_BRANA|nr:BnaC04g18640D [Brassica napus]
MFDDFVGFNLRVDVYLLPQSAFPSGGLYFKNKKWVNETNGKHVIVHNNYIVGYNQKLKRFQDFGLWLVDDFSHESPLEKLELVQEQNTEEKKQKGRGRKQTENRGQKQNIL